MENTNVKKKSNGILVILAIIVIAIILIAIKNKPHKIDLEELVTINYNGYHGYATAYAELDQVAIYDELQVIYSEKELKEKEQIELLNNLDDCFDAIELELNKESEIENGDKLTATISYDNKIAKKLGIKFTGKKVTVKVKDLEKVEKIDAFEELEVNFAGISPYGTVEFTYNGTHDAINTYSFSIDKRSNLRNGDKVKITIDLTDEQTLRNGYALKQKEKEFEVKGLTEYVESYTEIDGKFIESLKADAQDVIVANCAGYIDTCKLGDLTYSGYMFSVQKQDALNSYNNYNNLYIIYSGMLTDSADSFADTYVYFPVQYSNIMNMDGEYSYASGKNIMGWSNLTNSWYGTSGYINPIACYKEIVTRNTDSYETSIGDGFEKFDGDGFLTSLQDIDSNFKITLANDANERIQNYITTGYAETTNVENLELLGEYLLLAKNQGENYEANNKYILVYSATVSSTENNFPTSTVYFPIEYDGIVKLSDKEFICVAPKGLQGDTTYFPDSWYYTKGYLDGTLMFQKLVTVNRADYTYEMTDALKQFGE